MPINPKIVNIVIDAIEKTDPIHRRWVKNNFPTRKEEAEEYKQAAEEIKKHPFFYNTLMIFELISFFFVWIYLMYLAILLVAPVGNSYTGDPQSRFAIFLLLIYMINIGISLVCLLPVAAYLNYYVLIVPLFKVFSLNKSESIAYVNSSVMNGFLRLQNPEEVGSVRRSNLRAFRLLLKVFFISVLVYFLIHFLGVVFS